ncbi:helix-turn-helix domain-containing protein [Halorussus sp. AFM4]|uniref:helix-turn-helix domain-containing protein n=1 Tax=Halorussus sp. AFM4 TaxID=3421651 RepID=UPI003EBEDF41
MSLIAIAHIAHPDLALMPTISRRRDVDIQVIPQSATDPETGMFFFLVEGADEEFERALDEDHTVRSWTRVSRSDSTRVYRIRHPEETKLLSPRTVEVGGLMLEANSDETGWTVRLQLPGREELSDIWEFCEAEDITFELQQMFRQEEWTSRKSTSLTDAQRDALVTAYREGYFEEPRDVSLEELAEVLDISPTAVGGRIRRGTAELVRTSLLEE